MYRKDVKPIYSLWNYPTKMVGVQENKAANGLDSPENRSYTP